MALKLNRYIWWGRGYVLLCRYQWKGGCIVLHWKLLSFAGPIVARGYAPEGSNNRSKEYAREIEFKGNDLVKADILGKINSGWACGRYMARTNSTPPTHFTGERKYFCCWNIWNVLNYMPNIFPTVIEMKNYQSIGVQSQVVANPLTITGGVSLKRFRLKKGLKLATTKRERKATAVSVSSIGG